MRMRIDPAGKNKFARCVNNNVHFHIERLADSRHRLAVDKNICCVVVNGGKRRGRF